MRKLLFGLLILFIFTNILFAEKLSFVSIQYLIEQEVARLIIPSIYEKLNIDVEITPVPAKRAQVEATSGRKDGEILRIYAYGEENKTTLRVPTPYYQVETMAFIRKDSGIKIESKEDLKKYKVLKILGVKHTNNISNGVPDVSDIESTESMFTMVESNRADVALTSTLDGKIIIEKLGLKNITPIDKPLAVLDLYNYLHVSNKEYVPKVDAVIKEMKESGELKKIIAQAEKTVIARMM